MNSDAIKWSPNEFWAAFNFIPTVLAYIFPSSLKPSFGSNSYHPFLIFINTCRLQNDRLRASVYRHSRLLMPSHLQCGGKSRHCRLGEGCRGYRKRRNFRAANYFAWNILIRWLQASIENLFIILNIPTTRMISYLTIFTHFYHFPHAIHTLNGITKIWNSVIRSVSIPSSDRLVSPKE